MREFLKSVSRLRDAYMDKDMMFPFLTHHVVMLMKTWLRLRSGFYKVVQLHHKRKVASYIASFCKLHLPKIRKSDDKCQSYGRIQSESVLRHTVVNMSINLISNLRVYWSSFHALRSRASPGISCCLNLPIPCAMYKVPEIALRSVAYIENYFPLNSVHNEVGLGHFE